MAAGDSRGCDEFRGLLNGHGLIKELLGSRAYVTSTAGPETPLVHASAHVRVCGMPQWGRKACTARINHGSRDTTGACLGSRVLPLVAHLGRQTWSTGAPGESERVRARHAVGAT